MNTCEEDKEFMRLLRVLKLWFEGGLHLEYLDLEPLKGAGDQ